jgi:DNA polymerase III epsilon subunit family exonuclease
MIEKFFHRKNVYKKNVDPVSAYVMRLCSKVKENRNLDIPIQDAVFSVVDTETTGLEIAKAKIINIAAVKVKNFKIVDFYNAFINPGMKIPEDSIKWHGITDDMVKGKPSTMEVIPEFLKFVSATPIVGHHIGFDIRMINKEMTECFGCKLENYSIDTMLLYSNAILKRDEHVSLDYLFDVYNVQCTGRHTALGDALATAEVFNKIIYQANKNYDSVAELINIQKAFNQSQ